MLETQLDLHCKLRHFLKQISAVFIPEIESRLQIRSVPARHAHTQHQAKQTDFLEPIGHHKVATRCPHFNGKRTRYSNHSCYPRYVVRVPYTVDSVGGFVIIHVILGQSIAAPPHDILAFAESHTKGEDADHGVKVVDIGYHGKHQRGTG